MREVWVDSHQGLRLAGIVDDGKLTDLLAEPEARPAQSGSILLGKVLRVDRLAGGAFVDIGTGTAGWLPLPRGANAEPSADAVADGAALIIQTVGEPRDGKGARLTRDIALPGRYWVCRPHGTGMTASRSLKGAMPAPVADAIKGLPDMGWIVRRAAREAELSTLKAEAERLHQRWLTLERIAGSASPVSVLAPAPNVAQRVILDAGDAAIICVAPKLLHQAINRWLSAEMPEHSRRLRHEDTDLVDRMLPLLHRDVTLPSGGWLSIEPTIALTAIDVNAGAGRDPLRANLEAADAIAAHLRLRNIGGTVVIDFISMRSPKARHQVMATLKAALADDPARVRTGRGVSDLGLVELARERRGLALREAAAASPCDLLIPTTPDQM